MSHTDHFSHQKLSFSLSCYHRFGPRATCCKLSKYRVTPRPHKMAAAYGPQPSLKILAKGPRNQWEIILLLCPRNIIWWYLKYMYEHCYHVCSSYRFFFGCESYSNCSWGSWNAQRIGPGLLYSPTSSTWLQPFHHHFCWPLVACSDQQKNQVPSSWDSGQGRWWRHANGSL